MKDTFRILAINPGSTSTKLAVFENEQEVFSETIRHTSEELAPYKRIADQYEFRKNVIEQFLTDNNIQLNELDAIVGRGGLLKSIPGGTYAVNDIMVETLKKSERGEHASNLGGLIAYELCKASGKPAFIVDPVVVDEFEPVARISGHPDIERRSIFHALNQKAMARKAASDLGKPYSALNLVVAHLGGGISVGAHRKGRVIDVNDALSGEGPFSPERSGGLPAAQLVELVYSNKYTKEELKKTMLGKGGMVAYLQSNDMMAIEKKAIAGEEPEKSLHAAMAYQISKEIGSYAAVLKGEVDAIVLTGGIAYDPLLMKLIKERVSWIADVMIYPGEEELSALAMGGLRVLRGEEEALAYTA